MKKKLPLLYLALFAIVLGLLTVTTVSGARSSLIKSKDYEYQFEMYHIGITLLENEKEVGWRNFQLNKDGTQGDWVVNEERPLLSHVEPFVVGKTYPEILTVKNSGKIDEYVRVKVYKYWKSADGRKDVTKDPDNIVLTYQTNNGWIMDSEINESSSKERKVMYFTNILKTGEETPAFVTEFKVNNMIVTPVKKVDANDSKRIIYEYEYDGAICCLEVEADAVQTHNADQAIKSAWGKDVAIAKDGTLSFK